MKRYSPAYERNREPILEFLKTILDNHQVVLEIGSGPGQHACFFAEQLPHLTWQPSDVQEYLPSICAWQDEAQVSNLEAPFYLDLLSEDWLGLLPAGFHPDFIFNMNVAHIVSFEGVVNLVEGAGRLLKPGGRLFFYGPWSFRDEPLEPSNASFDERLKLNIPGAGIREFETVMELASRAGFELGELVRMPANNCAFYLNRL